MGVKKRLTDIFYYFIIGGVCAFAISSNALAATVIDVDFTGLIKYILIFMIAFYIIFFNRYTFFTSLGVGLVLSLILFFNFKSKAFSGSEYFILKEKILDFVDFVLRIAPYREGYDKILEIAVVFAITMVVASTVRSWLGFYAITLIGTITIAVPAIYNWNQYPIGRYLFLACFLILFLEKLNFFMDKNQKERTKVNTLYGLYLVPICFIIIAGTLFLPTFNLESVPVLDEINQAGYTVISEASRKTELIQRNKKELGGPLRLGDENVMEVVSDRPLYLKGVVMDTYAGHEWYAKAQMRKQLEPEENAYDTNMYDSFDYPKINEAKKLLGVRTAEVTVTPYLGVLSKRIFSPPYSQRLEFNESSPTVFTDGTGALWMPKTLTEGESYTQEYINWDYDDEQFQTEILNRADNGIKDPVYLAKYLQVPDTLPQRVTDLANEITAGAKSDYAKLRAIETYLRENYPYTTETSELPKGEDFVDYFLFTEKQGYCVYYATTMAVMARTQGIPTRYVEGYVMPPQRNADGNYTVTNQQAHAWVEAFFPEFGWVRFEPTSAYSADSITDYTQPENEEEIAQPQTPTQESQQDTYTPPAVKEDTQEQLDTDTNIPSTSNTEEHTKKEIPKGLTIVLSIALFILLVGVLVKFLLDYHKNKFESIKNLEPKIKTQKYFAHILLILNSMGYRPHNAETIKNFVLRIQPEIKTDLKDMTELHNKAHYSDEDVSKQEAEYFELLYEKLLTELQERKEDKLKFLIERYFLMRY